MKERLIALSGYLLAAVVSVAVLVAVSELSVSASSSYAGVEGGV